MNKIKINQNNDMCFCFVFIVKHRKINFYLLNHRHIIKKLNKNKLFKKNEFRINFDKRSFVKICIKKQLLI